MEALSKLIESKLLFLVVFVYCVGLFIKKIPNFKAVWAIPLILWGVGVVMSILVLAVRYNENFTGDSILTGVIQGTFIAALSVFGDQLYNQMVKPKLNSLELDDPPNQEAKP